MSSRKTITIFGATGKQGGSVVKALQSTAGLRQKYALRAVTRDTRSAAAVALEQQGVATVAASFDDPSSLCSAVAGSHGVFSVTNFWDPSVMNKDIELQQGKNVFDAAKAEGVKHFIWSSLPHMTRLTDGELSHMAHFDGKAEVEDYIEANKGSIITSYYLPAGYTDSYLGQIHEADGKLVMALPAKPDARSDSVWPIVDAVEDTGKYVAGLFEGGDAANGVRVQGVSFWTTPQEFVSAVGKIRGKEIAYKTDAAEQFAAKLPPFLAQKLTESFIAINEYSYYGKGSENKQADSDKWLLEGTKTITINDLA